MKVYTIQHLRKAKSLLFKPRKTIKKRQVGGLSGLKVILLEVTLNYALQRY